MCLAGNNCLGTNRKYSEQRLPKNYVVANKMKATVLYYSHKRKTAFFAREIAMYLWSKGLNVSLSAISDFDTQKLNETDFLMLDVRLVRRRTAPSQEMECMQPEDGRTHISASYTPFYHV